MLKYLLIVMCVSLSWGMSMVHAEDVSLNFDSAMGQLTSSLFLKNKDISHVRGIIQSYCTVVLPSAGFTQDGFVYNPKQSAFVYFLCQHVDSYPAAQTIPLFANKSIFALSSWKDIGLIDIHYQQDSKTDFCSSNSTLNQCNISRYVPRLYNTIINDYINLKQANLYGFTPNLSLDASANIFSQAYFDGLTLCSKDGPRQYPTTCKALKGYIAQAQQSMADVRIFKIDELLPLASAKGSCDPVDDNFNLLFCGLYYDTAYSLQRFLNLVYNEQFYYRLFAQYYLWMITSKPEMLGLVSKDTSSVLLMRTTTLSNELVWSQDALSLSLRMLRDSYSSFPLHIGLLMYQEDISNLFAPLGRLYTPISQLSDYTLRNVQQKQQ